MLFIVWPLILCGKFGDAISKSLADSFKLTKFWAVTIWLFFLLSKEFLQFSHCSIGANLLDVISDRDCDSSNAPLT